MRILVAQNVSRDRRGGMSRMLGIIHDQVEADGNSVDYFSSEDVPSRLAGRAARFAFPYLVWRHAAHAARAGRPYDVVNVHEPSAYWVAGRRAAAGNPAVVVTSHGVERRGWEVGLEEARLGRGGPALKTRLVYPPTSLWPTEFGLRRADHVFCLSCQDRDFLMSRFGIDLERITAVRPAADPTYIAAMAERDYSRARRLLFFGTWIRRKGIDDLASAFAVLAGDFPELELIVMGAGVPEVEVRATFAEPLRHRVAAVRTVTEHDVARVLVDCDIFVLPSLFEGTPQTLLEAMASGMPVITTATSGMRDVVQHGENGLLIPVRSPEAIIQQGRALLSSPELRARIGRAGHDTVARQYTWDRVAEPFREVYARLETVRRHL